MPMTRAAGRCWASATANAPDPVHRSTITGRAASRCAVAHANMASVSGRGMNTPGPTCSITGPNAAVPVRCCNGTRRERAATIVAVAPEELVAGRLEQGQPTALGTCQMSGQLLGIVTRRVDPRFGQ